MTYENRRFVIFNTEELPLVNFDQVHETSQDTVRKSVDGTKTFVKYETPQPTSIQTLTTKSEEYTYEQMLEILTTEEWTFTQPVEEI